MTRSLDHPRRTVFFETRPVHFGLSGGRRGGGTRLLRAAAMAVAFALFVGGCAPRIIGQGPATGSARLNGGQFIAADGYVMKYRVWQSKGPTRAIIIGVHGMNDYSFSFDLPGKAWAADGITTYAYDQRGFAGNKERGIWPGTDALVQDLGSFVRVIRKRHPKVPIFVAGVSMGGGVTMAAMAAGALPEISGAILVAPAVWARKTLPLAYRIPLTLSAYTIPAYRISGSRVGRKPTDNIAAWRATSRDPNVLKGTRVDAIWGVVNVMDRAYSAAPKLSKPILLLYGKKDQIIPPKPVEAVIARLPPGQATVAIYRDGWHWLLRDLQRDRVYKDVVSWTFKRGTSLPSGADRESLAAEKGKPGRKAMTEN